ncbi:hypothetical protein XM38_021400 [Halomicronema hongdechloris C2206]|uniref:Uncharacterized protein n=1 Tax=Halomicronema hongdechloris C2206 TaxID=1641165 RepID=A0A1Z3HLL6_9CYAN|nr:hypothetical protein XM38_021400 [Halomicronema hongdechloris C2206]
MEQFSGFPRLPLRITRGNQQPIHRQRQPRTEIEPQLITAKPVIKQGQQRRPDGAGNYQGHHFYPCDRTEMLPTKIAGHGHRREGTKAAATHPQPRNGHQSQRLDIQVSHARDADGLKDHHADEEQLQASAVRQNPNQVPGGCGDDADG